MSRFRVQPVVRPYVKDSTSPALVMYVRDDGSNLVTLSGLIYFFMYNPKTKVAKISAAAVIADPDQVANKGKCTYQWLTGELDTVGSWYCRLRFGTAEWSEGFTVPVENPADGQQVRYTT